MIMLRLSLAIFAPIALCTTSELARMEEQLQKGDSTNARENVMEILKTKPDSARANFALAQMLETTSEDADLVEAVTICVKVLGMSEKEVPDQLFKSVARFALTVAHNSDKEEIIEKTVNNILAHSRRHILPVPVIEDAMVQLGELLLVKMNLERAEQVLIEQAEEEVKRPGILLGLLQVVVMRINESRLGKDSGQSDEIFETL